MRPVEHVVDICRALVSYGNYIHVGEVPIRDGSYILGRVLPLQFAVMVNSPPLVDALLSCRLKFPDTVSRAVSAINPFTGDPPLRTAMRSG